MPSNDVEIDKPTHKDAKMSKTDLPTYLCRKTVRAAKINKVLLFADSSTTAVLVVHPNDKKISVGPDYLAKHKPRAGGYYVLYKDGYESWSPAKAFEEGYTKQD